MLYQTCDVDGQQISYKHMGLMSLQDLSKVLELGDFDKST